MSDDQEFRSFMETVFTRAREGHPQKEIVAQVRVAGYPVEEVRDRLAASLAIVTLDALTPDTEDEPTQQFVAEQREYARQLARLFLALAA